MKVKTIELSGAALDWVVAKCENKEYIPECSTNGIGMEFEKTEYCNNWAQGGKIIGSEDISIVRLEDEHVIDSKGFCTNKRIPVFGASIGRCFEFETLRNSHGEDCGEVYCIDAEKIVTGPTQLIAAMRCYVLSKLGDTVDIPDELV